MLSPKSLLPHTAGEAGALIEHGRAGKIVKKEADEIEHGGRFENRRVMSRFQSSRGLREAWPYGWRFRPSSSGSISRMSGEFDLAQPEEFSSRIVTENSAARLFVAARTALSNSPERIDALRSKKCPRQSALSFPPSCKRASPHEPGPGVVGAAVAAKVRATF